jgi:hypothetical protein
VRQTSRRSAHETQSDVNRDVTVEVVFQPG